VIVVDASAVLEVLLRTPAAPAIECRLHDMRETLHAPHLIDAELAHVIRRSAA
jgi:predicted nucleic acid-binding protein